MSFLLTLLEGIFSLWQSFKANAQQQIGQLKQKGEDDAASLKTAQDASDINSKVSNSTDAQLDADLNKRL